MSTKLPSPGFAAVCCACAVILAGCANPRQRVEQEMPPLRAQWQQSVAHQSALPDRALSWPEALALLHQDNLKLRTAKDTIDNSRDLAKQVYKDLIPMLSLDVGVTKSLKSLPSTSLDDVTFNIDSLFNVPGVVNFNARLFSTRLALMRAQASYLLAQREQTIELYKLFLEAREHEEESAELRKERAVAEAVRKVDQISGEVLLKDVDFQEQSLAKELEGFQSSVGDVLAERRFHWVLTTNGLPEFDYAAHPLPLQDTNRVAQLQMKMVALEIVGNWAQLHGIKLQYWPELSFFVTGPSIYQYMDNHGSWASPGNIVASGNMFWTLDTRGYISQQLKNVRRSQAIDKTQLQLDALALIDRLIAAQKAEGSMREQAQQLDRLMGFLDQMPPEGDVNSILQRAENNRSLRFQRAHLRHDIAEMNTLFWFVDEKQWTGLHTEICLNRE